VCVFRARVASPHTPPPTQVLHQGGSFFVAPTSSYTEQPTPTPPQPTPFTPIVSRKPRWRSSLASHTSLDCPPLLSRQGTSLRCHTRARWPVSTPATSGSCPHGNSGPCSTYGNKWLVLHTLNKWLVFHLRQQWLVSTLRHPPSSSSISFFLRSTTSWPYYHQPANPSVNRWLVTTRLTQGSGT
jgi:hypothetical protein